MGFMSNPSGGEGGFTPYVKYNAKAGRWYTKEDKQDGAEFEVTNMTAIMDLENIKTGWFLFNAGVAPAKTFDPSLAQAAAKPGDGFKRGFEVLAFSDKNLQGLREFSSTAGAVIEAMNNLYDAWEAGKAANPGKLPVVKCESVSPVTNKHGTNYAPKLAIVSWADRPKEMQGAAASSAPAASPAPSAPAQHVPPPPPPAAASDDDAPEF